MKKRFTSKKSVTNLFRFFVVIIAVYSLIGCSPGQSNDVQAGQNTNPGTTLNYMPDDDQLLSDSFRIDIQDIAVVFDYYPATGDVDCVANLVFRMRPGQQRPLIHLEPLTNGGTADRIVLNGETLSQSSSADIQVVQFQGSLQKALEFQRDLPENQDYTLEIAYRLNSISTNGRFVTKVNDLIGDGNELVFPTIDVPHELARHRLTFRVHSDNAYRCIGSGHVQSQQSSNDPSSKEENIQQWVLDTEREIASYTVMFALVPEEDVIYRERTINGVDVRLMVEKDDDVIERAFTVLEQCLPEFENDFGTFPMPRGLSLLVFSQWDTSMEYYGASIASIGNLKHEIFHMYFGCSTINKTYRDTWLDEAINYWYKYSYLKTVQPVSTKFKSGMVGDRSPIREGFDGTYYHIEGSQILESVAQTIGGRDVMIDFLRYLRDNYTFKPFTTFEFVDILKDYSGIDMKDWFLQWCYDTPRPE